MGGGGGGGGGGCHVRPLNAAYRWQLALVQGEAVNLPKPRELRSLLVSLSLCVDLGG